MTIKQLKQKMKSKKMTYEQLSAMLGLSGKASIAHWFSRGSVPAHWHKTLKEKLQ